MTNVRASAIRMARDSLAVLRARWYLRKAQLGTRVRVWGKLVVKADGTMIIGDRVRIASDIATTELAAVHGATLEIGEGTFINHGCSIAALESIRIGPGCSIGSHVVMMDNDFHSIDPALRDVLPPSRPIVLEANVWLGVRVIVLRGVRIGEGSVIGAGSVVTRDIPPRTLAGGNPARPIRSI